MAVSKDQALEVARGIGYPVVVRPSYVLGGRAMAIVYDAASLERYMANAVDASPERPILIDRFLEDAFELDVDALADAEGHVVIGGVMEHIEEAGIHSGDSSCVVPTYLVADKHLHTIRDYTRRIARALKVIGLMNAQFAIKDDQVYVLEVNPRASRTVPYLSKASGVPLAKMAARLMAGETLPGIGLTQDIEVTGVFVKAPVFPFVRFPGVDTILGPEMKSTGEVMGGASSFGTAFAKAQLGAGQRLPLSGAAFISVNNDDKPNVLGIARDLAAPRLQAGGDARHRRVSARARPRRRRRLQDQRRPAARRRSHLQQGDRARHQHADGARVVLRRPHRPARGDDEQRAVHHHADRRRGDRQRDPRAARGGPGGPLAAGIPRRRRGHVTAAAGGADRLTDRVALQRRRRDVLPGEDGGVGRHESVRPPGVVATPLRSRYDTTPES